MEKNQDTNKWRMVMFQKISQHSIGQIKRQPNFEVLVAIHQII
jgi:hypothetical protein